jgi:hypothetical protein
VSTVQYSIVESQRQYRSIRLDVNSTRKPIKPSSMALVDGVGMICAVPVSSVAEN